ncbi:MAG: T9SS type A sorting domain-containing protein, partial [Gammaproteobacteria bacterium]|nr:T9SS type A sorting domain-containing protein [Gammaproteobacteria bacterium]
LILAGAQDQGYQRSDRSNGNLTREFEQLISGDYGHITSGDGTHDLVYSVYPGFVLVQTGELNPGLPGMLDFPSGENHSWIPYTLANPENNNEFYICASHLHKGNWNGGNNVTYTASAQNFAVGGSNYLTAVSISAVDHDYRLAVTNIGRLWFSVDGGNHWTDSGFSGPSAHYFYGTALVHSPVDERVAWVGGSGYSGPAVYETRDGGLSWTIMSDNLPSTLVYDLAIESAENEVLYAATEAGPYRLDPDTELWDYIGGTEAPLTTYWSVESVPADQLIRFGTYGRGIWDFDVTSPLSGVDYNAPEISAFALQNYPNPFNPLTTIRFNIQNSSQVQVGIFDLAGRQIRSLYSGQLSAGSHELNWDGRAADGASCASAVYFVKVQTEGKAESLRITLAK